VKTTGTCFIQKIYAPSSSLLHGKHLPFSSSPFRHNIFRLFVILSLTQLYRYTPEIFLFSTVTFKYTYWHLIFKAPFFYFLNQFRPDRKWLYPFQWHKSRKCDVRWIFLSNSSEGGPVDIFKCGSRKEKYLGSVTI
jgi:hypothetical protein